MALAEYLAVGVIVEEQQRGSPRHAHGEGRIEHKVKIGAQRLAPVLWQPQSAGFPIELSDGLAHLATAEGESTQKQILEERRTSRRL